MAREEDVGNRPPQLCGGQNQLHAVTCSDKLSFAVTGSDILSTAVTGTDMC